MNGLPVAVSLQDQHTWTLRIVRIILKQQGLTHASHQVTNEDAFICEFFVAVFRYLHLVFPDQVEDPLEGVAHRLMSRAAESRGKQIT